MRMETENLLAQPPAQGSDQFRALKVHIGEFLAFLTEEQFEDGRNWSRRLVSEQAPTHPGADDVETYYKSLHRSENEFDYAPPPYLMKLSPDLAFLMYAGNYFSARCKIEQSYHYQHAHRLIELSLRFLKVADEGSGLRLLPIIGLFSRLQDQLSEIERACYTSDESLIHKAASDLQRSVEAIRARDVQLSPEERDLYQQFLEPRTRSA